MSKILTFLSLMGLLIGCAKVPVPAGQPTSTLEGQETHGGDLAVAMLRTALLTSGDNDPERRPLITKLMTMLSTSVDSTFEAPLFEEKNGLLEVNRTRALFNGQPELLAQIFGVWDGGLLTPPGQKMLPHYRGRTMTPELFRERGIQLLGSLQFCFEQNYELSFLMPSFDKEKVKGVRVEYSSTPLYDTRIKRRVDVGVTLDSEPRILLDSARIQDWTANNYANDYLVYHEYAHVLLRTSGRSDEDHVLALLLYSVCSPSSLRYQLRFDTPLELKK